MSRYASGEPLRVEQLLAAAGPQADELAVLIDRFLERSPRRSPTAASRAYVESLHDSPLLEARVQRRLSRAVVVGKLVAVLGLEGHDEKVALRYHELESGLLDGGRVSERVWDALSSQVGEAAVKLMRVWRQPPPQPVAAAYFRLSERAVHADALFELPPAEHEPEPDEVDRLFGIG